MIPNPRQALLIQEVRNRGAVSVEASAEAANISIHTVTLPPRAPKQLLLDLKDVFLRYPGREKVQLKIGDQLVALPVTVTMSPLLEQRIDDVLGRYAEV